MCKIGFVVGNLTCMVKTCLTINPKEGKLLFSTLKKSLKNDTEFSL